MFCNLPVIWSLMSSAVVLFYRPVLSESVDEKGKFISFVMTSLFDVYDICVLDEFSSSFKAIMQINNKGSPMVYV